MNDLHPSTPFDLSGSFGGFVFTETGKRRMRLHAGGEDCLLKVPRLLRRRLIGTIRPGDPIHVTGTQTMNPETGSVKRVVGTARAGATPDAPAAAAVACVVRVCSKKNCWRKGGRELWQALERERTTLGLAGSIELRQVGCLDRCKQAPNADGGGHEYTDCHPADARAILDGSTGKA